MRKIIFTLLLFSSMMVHAQQHFPFKNTQLSFEQRVDDLVARLTLEEKVAQMLNAAPAIERFGIPTYDWWNEVLHGVARTPYRVTVYPQAIAMAATFDTFSLKQMAHYSALEGRAVYNKAIQDGRAGQRYVGITYWKPNINIFRALKGFQWIFLKAGESKNVTFTLTPDDLSIMDEKGKPIPLTGVVTISVGGSQPDESTVKNKTTIQANLQIK